MKDLLQPMSLKRIVEPDEISRMVVALVSDAASYVTGRTIFGEDGMTDYPDFAQGGRSQK
jgi:NAD(P)-dependent dehydrogenase (short-subunit alcohol dehydrogenase family)